MKQLTLFDIYLSSSCAHFIPRPATSITQHIQQKRSKLKRYCYRHRRVAKYYSWYLGRETLRGVYAGMIANKADNEGIVLCNMCDVKDTKLRRSLPLSLLLRGHEDPQRNLIVLECCVDNIEYKRNNGLKRRKLSRWADYIQICIMGNIYITTNVNIIK